MLGPSDRKMQALAFIRGIIHAKGRARSVREIQRHFECKSPNATRVQMTAIQQKGLAVRDPGSRARAVRISGPSPQLAFPYAGTIS